MLPIRATNLATEDLRMTFCFFHFEVGAVKLFAPCSLKLSSDLRAMHIDVRLVLASTIVLHSTMYSIM